MVSKKLTRLLVAIAAILIFSTYAKGQVWCPPGATWYYGEISMLETGYSKYTYVNDTVIKGITCKKIIHFYRANGVLGIREKYFPSLFTYMENGVVYKYNNIQGENKFDTIFNINAKIGDKWHLPAVDTLCPDSMYYMRVLNTGTKMLNGVNLKWIYVKKGPMQRGNQYYYENDTITERFGLRLGEEDFYLCSNVVVEWSTGKLRCYSDDSFGTYSTGVSETCDFVTRISESPLDEVKISLYPNPANDKINVMLYSTPKGMIELKIFDLTGRLVRSTEFNKNTEISISSLDSGVYTYRCIVSGSYFQSGKISVLH